MMLGVIPVGAAVGPTLLHVAFVPPWNRMLALASSASVGGLDGSSCAIRLSTAGVYGASAATAGELAVEGSRTGRAYGTSAGVLGSTRLAPARPAVSPAVLAPEMLAPAGAAAVVRNETAASAATAAAGSLTGNSGLFLLVR
jgi:hypothetical protein